MRNTHNGNHLPSRIVLVAMLLAATASAQVRINSDAQLPGAGVGQVYNTTIIAAGGTGPYTFQVTTGSLPGGLTLQPNGQITGSPNAAGTANFTITATDANLAAAPKQFSLPVAATPLTLQVTGNSTSVGLGRYVELGFAGQGGLGPYRYRWASGPTLPPGVFFEKQAFISGPFPQGFTRIRGTPRTAGVFAGVMEVIDSQERVAQANFTFTVTSDPLVLPGASLPDGRRFIPYSFQLAATGGFAPIQYEQVGGSLPAGLSVSSDGRIEGIPTSGIGASNFSVTAIDANGVSVVTAYTMTMVNPPGKIIATPPVLPTGVVGISYLTIIRLDSNSEFSPGLWSITGGSLPPGLGIGSDSGEISGTPNTPGVYNFQVTNDNGGALLQKDFTLTISPTLFEWTSYTIKFLEAGQFTEFIDATAETAGGTPVGPVRYIQGSWGPAISNTPLACCVAGTPPASAVYGFLASVTAQDGQIAQKGYTAEISAVQPLIALNPASPPQGLLGQRYRFHESGCNPVCTNKGGGHPYRWSLSSGTLPTGLTLAPDGEISGVPTQSGVFFVTLQLTDAYGSSVSQAYDLVIGNTTGSLTMTTTSPLPQGTINTPYSTDILTTGGTAPVTFSVTGGATPPGLTLAPNGTLSGTPTVGGNYNFTVSAFDSSPASGGGPLGVSRAFSLFIFSPTPPPTLSQISPNTIVEGSAGFTLTATGTDFSSPTILWNGSPLTTSPGGVPTEITAAVPAGLVAAAGIAQVTVRNGDLQVSAPRPFTITPRPPQLTSISPTQVPAGGPAFLLTATGQFFTATAPGPVILFNGVPLTTQSFSSTQVQAMVPANLIANGGVVSVRIQNQDLQESNSQQLAVGNPPVLNSISPTLVATGSGSFTITATGSNFTAAAPGATIIFDGTPLTTSSFSPTQVQATVPANLINSPGVFEVWVRNQDLQDSNIQILQVATPPVLSTINPTQVNAGGPSFVLTATGTNFTTAGPGAVILFNGTPLTTSSFSGTQVQATVLASQITTAGVATIRVRNQTGQESNAVSLTIGSPPVLNSINPTLVATGSGSFNITATGTNFTAAAPGATIVFNGTPLTTSSFSGTQVQATVPANLITSPGEFEVRVRNQDLQESNAQLLQVATPPVLSSINPTQVNAGGPSFLLTATGTNFTTAGPGAVILFNGTPLTTSSFSGTQVQATVQASQITTAGVATIRVRNQTGQESNAVFLSIGNPPVLNTINPTLVTTGSGAFNITATGTNFTAAAPGATIIFNGTPLTTASFSGTQVQATVPANLITTQGEFEVRVRNQDLQESNAQTLSVASPPVLTSLNPPIVTPGSGTFVLSANGTNFTGPAPGSVLLFNGTPLATTGHSLTTVSATVPAALIQSPGTATIRIRNQNGLESNAISLQIGTIPVLQSINPQVVGAGSATFTLTGIGTNFSPPPPGAVLLFNGTPLQTLVSSGIEVLASVPANLVATPGSATIRVRNQNQEESNAITLVISPVPILTSLTPSSALAGSPTLTLTVNGANFDEGTQVLWNGTPVPTVTDQSDESTATIAANLLATPGTATVQVRKSNGLTSQPLVFTIQPQVSTITRLLPDTLASGSPANTITIEGTNFRSDSVALFDGQALTTYSDSATSIRALIDADRLSQPGAFPITVRSPQGTLSNAVNLTVTGPGPQITALDPPNRQVGSPSFVLTVDGAGFEVLSVIRFNGVALSTDFFSTSRLRATVPTNLLQVTGTVPVLVESPNGLRSAPRQFAIRLPAPVIRSLVPSSVPAGSGPTPIIVEGTDFQAGAVVVVQGTDLATTGPGNRLTATVPANLLTVASTLAVTVRNPDGQSAVAVNLTVTGTAPGPQITSLTPPGVQSGSSAFVLTVNGAGFQTGSTVLWGTAALPTTFGSATQLTAQVTADRVAAPGSVAVTVRNPDGRASAAVAFVISTLPAPVLSSLSPTNAAAGGAAFVLILNGSGFQPGALARWQGQDLPTSFVSATQVNATIAAQRIASAGQFEVTLRNPDGLVSNPLTFAVQTATPPVITSVSPNESVTGLASLLLDVRGQQFQAGALLLWNGEPLASTTVVSATQLQAVVDQQRLQVPGSATLQVRNPNGQVSNSVPFVLRFVLPRLISMAPLAALAGATEVTLNLTVENVRSGAVVTWNGSSLPTVLTGPNQLTAQVLPAALLAQPGSANVAVRNPDGLASNSITFVILAPRPVISRIAPDRVVASQPDVRLQVFGSGFRSGVQVRLGGVPVTTSFLNNGELLVFVPVDRIAVPGSVSVQAVNTDGQSSDAVQLTVLPSLTPELTGLTPGFVAVGSGNTLVAVAGRNFVPGTRVLVEGVLAETRYVSETQLEVQVPQAQLGFVRALQLTVRNPDGKTSSPRALTVGEPLRITAIQLPSGVVGLTYRYAFRATGGVPDYRWTTESTLPPGLTLSPEGVLSGTPTGPPATTALLVRVTDTAGNTERAQAPLVIESADLEILSVSPLPPATSGAAYSFQFQARATAGLPLVWSVVEGTLPAGLELNAATGRITGIAAEPPEPVATTEASRAASVPVIFAFGVEVSALGRNPSRRTFELTVLPATGEFRITTPAPLAPGTVRRPYAVSFATAGGTLPVSFTLSGRLPAGVSLGADGRLTGVPEEAGTFPLTVQARDAAQRLATRAYEWQVRATAEGPEILSGPLLPITGGPAPMDVLIEARGGRRPFTWSIIAGSLPPGIRFDPVTARLTGTPLQTGVFRFTVRVLDADGLQDLRVIELPVTATGEPLQLVTQTLPGVGAGVSYNAALEARGGMPPYRFAVAEGSLPAGLSLVGAQIQGVPTVPGTSTFRLRLTDEIGFVLHRDFTITTTLGVVPALSITGLPDRIEPGSQPRVGVQLAASFPLDLLGNLGLTFVSDPPVAGIDPALQFSSGGRTVAFRIPAGQTEAVFPQAALALQTGTVAGVLTAAINGLQAGGTAAPTANRPDRTVQITHLPPVIREALFEATPTGFTITVTGFSTTREVQEAVVTLTPAPGQQLQSTTLVVPLAAVFRQWYDSAASLPFGTQFRLALPFNATGGAVQSATIRLRNSIGESR
jgi:polyisoprenoid-binding protein YceI